MSAADRDMASPENDTVMFALILLGFASLLFGLIVIMPILGHASWHAYRELVE